MDHQVNDIIRKVGEGCSKKGTNNLETLNLKPLTKFVSQRALGNIFAYKFDIISIL